MTDKTPPHIIELAANIRRNLDKMSRIVNLTDENGSALLGFINHCDTLAQQIVRSNHG